MTDHGPRSSHVRTKSRTGFCPKHTCKAEQWQDMERCILEDVDNTCTPSAIACRIACNSRKRGHNDRGRGRGDAETARKGKRQIRAHKGPSPSSERRCHLLARCCPRRPRCHHSPPPSVRFNSRHYTSILSMIRLSQNTFLSLTTSASRSVDKPTPRLFQQSETAISTRKC